MRKVLSVAVCVLFFSGCIAHHTVRPIRTLGQSSFEKIPQTLTYSLTGSSLFGGTDELRHVLKEEAPFETVEHASERPDHGYHVDIRVEIIPPSMFAFAWGYISVVGLLTLLPAWTGKDGSRVYYELFRDGQRVKTYEYEIRRKGLIWIVTLPFIWANLLTRSERDAFKLTTKQFFSEAAQVVR